MQRYRRAQSYRKSLLLHRVNQQKKEIKNLNWKTENFSSSLQQKIEKLVWIGVKNFIKNCQQQESFAAKKVHHSKLNDLGLDERNVNGDPNVITNLSSHALTSYERSALNKSLNYSILPSYFNFLQIQASFECIYQEIQSDLRFKERIELKRMILIFIANINPDIFA